MKKYLTNLAKWYLYNYSSKVVMDRTVWNLFCEAYNNNICKCNKEFIPALKEDSGWVDEAFDLLEVELRRG